MSDLSPLAGLTTFWQLDLGDHQISDISPLVENSELGAGDTVNLVGNNLDLSEGSEDLENVRKLESRGVRISY